MKISRIHLIIISLLVVVSFWFLNHLTTSTVSNPPISSQSGLVSDLANPFGSGNSNKTLFDATPTQPVWETSSGAAVYYNTNWMGRTVEIHGKPVHYQFGRGNPVETDKTRNEIIELNKLCRKTEPSSDMSSCISALGQGENLSNITLPDGTDGFSHVSRMTPEIEYLVYSFLSNPLIRQSSERCGEFFWRDGEEGAPFYNNETMREDMGEVSSENWWKPYRIDINQLIVINPTTGRKELNTEPIQTLNTQIQYPAVTRETWGYYTNIKLTKCLAKNNILTPLQSHVSRHYSELMWLWREWKEKS
jgi:hypothetical protein